MFHKTQQMCDEAVVRDDGTLKFVPDDYKTQKMCHKGVDNYGDASEYVSKCFKTQEMCDKAGNIYSSVPECFISKKNMIKLSISFLFYLILFLIYIKLKNV